MAASLLTAAISVAQTPAAKDPPKPPPDVVTFTNGDQLTGSLERGVGDFVVFKSDMTGEVTVPLAKVKELRSSGKFVVLLKGAPLNQRPTPSYRPTPARSTPSSVAGPRPSRSTRDTLCNSAQCAWARRKSASI